MCPCDAVKELALQSDVKFRNVFHASGTGATQAGLHVGFKQFQPKCQVIGISVAREYKRGLEEVAKFVGQLESHLEMTMSNAKEISFDDSYRFEGYESTSVELLEFTKNTA